MIDAVIPTTKDPTLAPEGEHIMTCFVHYAPYRLKDGSWEGGAREKLADTVVETLSEYAPNFRDSIIYRQSLTPYDLEQRFGLIGGNIFHGEMALDQLFSSHLAPGLSGYRTPISDLYMYGSGRHAGGGVMGGSRGSMRPGLQSGTPRAKIEKSGFRDSARVEEAFGERERVS